MDSIVFTLCDVSKKLERLNPNKSLGPDGMHPNVLRELSTTLAEPLYATSHPIHEHWETPQRREDGPCVTDI